MRYFKLRSWHILRVMASGRAQAFCGKLGRPDSETSNDLPMDEKSCESCLRFARHALGL